MKKICIFLLVTLIISGCKKDKKGLPPGTEKITIFFVNDPHGQINNFAKIKHIIDLEKLENNVITVCSGDMFSGNPVVDNHPQKGYPIIDIMNRVGFDISAIGNHEFDYGESILADRTIQANFDWVCANVNMENTNIPQPYNYRTISVGDIKVTFLGLVETRGSNTYTMPDTHPWRVKNLIFKRPENVISQYANIKSQENSDIYIALTHLGHDVSGTSIGDYQVATQYPYFDLILGGHSHEVINTTVNDIPIFQTGYFLDNLGKIELTVKDKMVQTTNLELINLNAYSEYDMNLKAVIDNYNNLPFLNEVIGYAHLYHEKFQIGCLFADALKSVMNVDVAFHNASDVRSELNEGNITTREIFKISPFSYGTIIFNMSVSEIKNFLKGSKAELYFSGIQIEQIGNTIQIKDLNNNIIPDNTVLSVGTNDYIPAFYESYFLSNGNIQSLTVTETIIAYLENFNSQVNYPNCDHLFKYH